MHCNTVWVVAYILCVHGVCSTRDYKTASLVINTQNNIMVITTKNSITHCTTTKNNITQYTQHHKGSKANITRWVSENKIVQFQAFGHEDTNWTKWLDASKPYYAVYKTFDGVWPSEVGLVKCLAGCGCVGMVVATGMHCWGIAWQPWCC